MQYIDIFLSYIVLYYNIKIATYQYILILFHS